MSNDLSTAEDREDAAFRARLAPLASEVLPGAAKPAVNRDQSAPRVGTNARRQLIAPAAVPTRQGAAAARPLATTGRRALPALSAAAVRGFRTVRWPVRQWANAWTTAGGSRLRSIALAATAVMGANASPPGASPPARKSPWRTPWWFVGLGGIAVVIAEAWLSHRPQPFSAPVAVASMVHIDAPSLSPPASKDMVGLLMQRGDAALAVGDIVGARLLFERAAALGSAAAAMAAGKSYDGDFLLRTGVRGIRADPAMAAAWYRKAAALGDPEARARIADQNRPGQTPADQPRANQPRANQAGPGRNQP